jgi:hypothetical protein
VERPDRADKPPPVPATGGTSRTRSFVPYAPLMSHRWKLIERWTIPDLPDKFATVRKR